MTHHQNLPKISLEELRVEIQKEYTNVALDPNKGYHFHTGRKLADLLGYDEALYADLPEPNIASFAGTGNPFSVGDIDAGEATVDVGSGAGFDSPIASRLVLKTARSSTNTTVTWTRPILRTRWTSARRASRSARASRCGLFFPKTKESKNA